MSAGMSVAADNPSTTMTVLSALLRGEATSGGALANTLRVDALGFSTFGRTDALDLFATHPLLLSEAPHVLVSLQSLAVIDETPDGRCFGVFADLADGVIVRLWVVAATAADAQVEAAVPLARDDFLNQLRQACQGDSADHTGLDAKAWPMVLSLGGDALLAAIEPHPASSSQAVVMRAFSVGDQLAALYWLRLQEHTAPRRAHRRMALAAVRRDAKGLLVHSRVALSDPLLDPAPVFFFAP
jgi:hypothetical protein